MLPDLNPWLENESDLYEELSAGPDFPYDEWAKFFMW